MKKLVFPLLLCILGIGLGYLAGNHERVNKKEAEQNKKSTALRLSGYKYISPLLVCDSIFTGSAPELKNLQEKLETAIQSAKDEKSIKEASVYFRDIKTGGEISINGTEKYYPASLKKVPLMMQYYKSSELDPSILSKKEVLNDARDYNQGTVIPPAVFAKAGKSYTNQELIDYMIKYSDNNSFQALFEKLGVEKFNKIYTEMQLHYPDTVVAIEDYVTAYQFSLFFRSLYNGTYLNNTNSERALDLLTQVDFKDGLVAGVPQSIKVAHKFGVGAVDQTKGNQVGELHDCGIVYNENNPYLICVMTKSESTISNVQKFIANLSAITFSEADNNYK